MLWERLSRHVIYTLTKKDSGNVIDVMTDTSWLWQFSSGGKEGKERSKSPNKRSNSDTG